MLDTSHHLEGRTSNGLPVGLHEQQILGLIQFAGWDGFEARAAEVLSAAGLGLPAQDGQSLRMQATTLWRVAPDRVLIHGDCPDLAGHPDLASLDLSGARRLWRIEGAGAVDLLSRVTSVNLSQAAFPVGGFVTTGIHGVAVLIDRTGAETFELHVPTTWAASVLEFIALHLAA